MPRLLALQSFLDRFTYAGGFVAGPVVYHFFGRAGNEPVILAVNFILADFITGILKGAMRRDLNSHAMWIGLGKKLAMVTAISFGHLLDMTSGTTNAIKCCIAYYICGAESVSILENLVACGVPLPQQAIDALRNLPGAKEAMDAEKVEDASDSDKKGQP